MKFFASLDTQDRKLMLVCLATVAVLAVLIGIFSRNENRDDNPIPSSYLTGRHGARAAYELLQEDRYSPERWEEPLSDVAARTDAQTVVIVAEPLLRSTADFNAVNKILKRGGRVLLTGIAGGELAPENSVRPPTQFQVGACRLTPEGLDRLANSGEVWMVPAASWKLSAPRYRVDYNCGGEPVVVEYDTQAGHVVWWASSTPLENGSIGRGGNVDLFLNALGSRAGHHFYWDESLHGDVRSQWFYARGAALNLLMVGLGGLGLLVVFSFSRRSGPVRNLPLPERATPVEFLEALGGLYARAGAAATAVDLAYQRFRRAMGGLCGLNGMPMNAAELAGALRRRFPLSDTGLEADLADCEHAAMDENLVPKRALALVQMLDRYSEWYAAAVRRNKLDVEMGQKPSLMRERA